MKSLIVPVVIALFGFALMTLADMGELEAEEAKIIEDFESGMFDQFISIETEINDSDVDTVDEGGEDMDGSEDRLFHGAWCRLKCLPRCAAAPNGTCTCTKMFLGIFPIFSITIPCA
ncbi:uncharacterized protein LOC131892570 [Tigriopus californicus]|uniref:uncharacterized protein LOC131892570 n=1 Tax=Tigriopus californicus TaxID=6832 RepID=UPI0027DA496A|nr:uncharacterized protein LOC131892570 [Tigriopus californicus]|eukprot:TCALIF_13785-PA protein Name:"Protein of unknown function" AED:0.06 eAED:0.06 QI:24/1/0.5/1/0/0/2/0/116